jgi:hypothetical protein
MTGGDLLMTGRRELIWGLGGRDQRHYLTGRAQPQRHFASLTKKVNRHDRLPILHPSLQKKFRAARAPETIV